MADTFTKFDNSADDIVKQQQKTFNQANQMFQTYGNKEVSVAQLKGKFNQTNTPGGMESSTESRKARR